MLPIGWRTWWKAFRFHYASASFMPGILGGVIAWTTDRMFDPACFLLALLGLVLNHLALNMTDDYYDFRHLVDVVSATEENPYTGGSGTLSAGQIQPKTMKNVFVIFYAVAISIGIFLGFMRGAFIHILLVFGFFCAFFYTAPPVRFGYRGFGEIAQLICFGPGIGLGAYFVQTQRLSWEALWGTLPLGIMLFSMITINEIPDYELDRRGGKLNLVARLGREKGVWLFIVSLFSAYVTIVLGVILGRVPFLALISLVTLPLAFRTISTLRSYYHDRVRMASANLGMICIHNFTAILLIFAYSVVSFNSGALVASCLPLLTLVLLYIPTAKALLSGLHGRSKKRDQLEIAQT